MNTLKWPGGKGEILPAVLEVCGPALLFVDPFMGSGIVARAYAERGSAVHASDVNASVVGLHHAIAVRPHELVGELWALSEFTKEHYYAVREAYNDPSRRRDVGQAALFLWLNRMCFNGLYRENRSGRMNTPVGSRATFPTEAVVEAVWAEHRQWARASLGLGLAAAAVADALDETLRLTEVAVLYLDPPYLFDGKGFTQYSAAGLDYTRLLADARRQAARGARVVMSNDVNPVTRELLGEPVWHKTVKRRIAAKGPVPAVEGLWVLAP
jgi:DNA adenine methylase